MVRLCHDGLVWRPDRIAAGVTILIGLEHLITGLSNCQNRVGANAQQFGHELGLVNPTDTRLLDAHHGGDQVAGAANQCVDGNWKTVTQTGLKLVKKLNVQLKPGIVLKVRATSNDVLGITRIVLIPDLPLGHFDRAAQYGLNPRDFPPRCKVSAWAKRLQNRLGDEYFVLEEPNHLHVQWNG